MEFCRIEITQEVTRRSGGRSSPQLFARYFWVSSTQRMGHGREQQAGGYPAYRLLLAHRNCRLLSKTLIKFFY